VKKIPFLLEVKNPEEAFKIAVDGGDPNNINKVLSKILEDPQLVSKNEGNKFDYGGAIMMVAKVPDGLRHLRNFAKARKRDYGADLIQQLYMFVGN
jgi:hypothetical protein